MSGRGQGGEPAEGGPAGLPRRQRIGVIVMAAAVVVALIDVVILQHFGENAATRQYPDDYLNAIACPSATQCWAVGQAASAPGGNTLSESRDQLLKRETAGRWHTVPARELPVRRGALQDITCPGASDCWAVGSSGEGAAVVEHWTGGTWQLAPSPAVPGGQLDEVGCASPRACWAIGGTRSRTGATGDVMEVWNGAAWSMAATLPTGLRPEQLSCPAAGHCMALGLRKGRAAAAVYSAGRWDQAPAPAFYVGFGGAGPSTGLAARYGRPLLGCASPSMCLVAFPGGPEPVTATWNGRAWRAAGTSLPRYPVGLNCSAAEGCWLLGMTGRSGPAALHWTGTGWTAVPVATPHHRHGYLNALACGSSCWVVGGSGGARANGAPYTYSLIEPLPVTASAAGQAAGDGGRIVGTPGP